MKKILIEQATEAQLRAFSRNALGIEIHANAKLATVIAKVKEAWDKPEIVVADDDMTSSAASPASADQRPVPITDGQLSPLPGMVRIFISLEDVPGGDEAVPVGLNGKVMLIPRNKNVDIPVAYWGVLQDAVKNIYDPLPDGKGINPIPRKVPGFPIRLVAEGPAAVNKAA